MISRTGSADKGEPGRKPDRRQPPDLSAANGTVESGFTNVPTRKSTWAIPNVGVLGDAVIDTVLRFAYVCVPDGRSVTLGKMTLVTSDEVIRFSSFGAFEESVVVEVSAFFDSNAWLDPMAQLSNRLECAFDNGRWSLQMWASDYLCVFGKDGIGYAKLHLTGKSKHQHSSRKTLRLEQRGNKNVGVDNDADH